MIKIVFTLVCIQLIVLWLLLYNFMEFISNYLNLNEKDMINYFKEKRKLKKKKTNMSLQK